MRGTIHLTHSRTDRAPHHCNTGLNLRVPAITLDSSLALPARPARLPGLSANPFPRRASSAVKRAHSGARHGQRREQHRKTRRERTRRKRCGRPAAAGCPPLSHAGTPTTKDAGKRITAPRPSRPNVAPFPRLVSQCAVILGMMCGPSRREETWLSRKRV